MKTIDIAQILSPDLKSRMWAQDLKLLMVNSGEDAFVLDFSHVKFATRSFMDEFYNLFLKDPKANAFSVTVTNVPEDIKASLMALAASSVLLCANGQYYVGSTENLERRLKEHQNGTGCGFTKAHLPVKLVYKEEYTTIEEAYQRERQLHGWSRKKKEALISGDVDALQSASTAGS